MQKGDIGRWGFVIAVACLLLWGLVAYIKLVAGKGFFTLPS